MPDLINIDTKHVVTKNNFSENRFMETRTESKPNSDIRYTLDVRIPKKIPQRMDIVESVNLGSDPRNDIIIGSEEGFSSKQFIFRIRANTLIGINLVNQDNSAILNQTPMIEGKHYILEKGDIIILNSVEIIIRQDSTSSLAKGLENSNPKLKFLDNAKKENSGSAKIKKTGTSSIKIEENKVKATEKKTDFIGKIKNLFKKNS